MKTKHLSKRNFRYVTKLMIKNPMIYIDDFFKYQTSINTWIRDIDLIINAGAYSAMASPSKMESGFHCKQLIEQVELAYVIYKQCGLKKQPAPLDFFKSRTDYFNYTLRGLYTCNGKVDPAGVLSNFFSFQSLNKWYDTLDDLMGYLTQTTISDYDRFGDRIVAIKELLFRLAYALHDIYENGGIIISVPAYVIAQPTEVFAGKMPRSKLGEFIDKMIDEHREKLVEEHGNDSKELINSIKHKQNEGYEPNYSTDNQ